MWVTSGEGAPFTGFHAKSRFSPDTAPKSAIEQLAAMVLVAFFVHVALVWVARVTNAVLPQVPQVSSVLEVR